MKLGLLTACLPTWELADVAGWAAQHGYRALEVAAWPGTDERPFTAAHIAPETLDAAGADKIHALLDGHGLTISSLAYYENNLHQDRAVRRAVNDHVKACIDAAVLLGVPTVGTFPGRDNVKSVAENIREGDRVLPELIDYAGERGIRLIVENCPMEGWHPDGYPGNLSYSPELWDWLIGLGFWLNYDPSHLVGLGIEPLAVLRDYLPRVAHVQAKDIEILPGRINRYGFFGRTYERTNPWDHTWWRFRLPGLGEVPWPRLVDVLYEGGFDGTVSVEHEDPLWRGSPDKVLTGLQIAHTTLAPLIVA